MLDFRDYLHFAERYLLLGEDEVAKGLDAQWVLVPSTILAWSAIECFVNNRLDELGALPDDMFELHERAFLLERRLKFEDKGASIGQFILEGTEYRRIEDKIFFLMSKLGKSPPPKIKGDVLWQEFLEFKEVRDGLIHPRRHKDFELNVTSVNRYLETSKKIIRLISINIWKEKIEI